MIAIDSPALSDGAERFLSIMRSHGMHSECVPAARRELLTVRVTWTAADGTQGTIDCLAFTTLDAIAMNRERMPGATLTARVIRGNR